MSEFLKPSPTFPAWRPVSSMALPVLLKGNPYFVPYRPNPHTPEGEMQELPEEEQLAAFKDVNVTPDPKLKVVKFGDDYYIVMAALNVKYFLTGHHLMVFCAKHQLFLSSQEHIGVCEDGFYLINTAGERIRLIESLPA